MKNLSETAVGLAYSALVFGDRGLAAEVRHLEDRLDEMKDHLLNFPVTEWAEEVTIKLPMGERRFKVLDLVTLPEQLKGGDGS